MPRNRLQLGGMLMVLALGSAACQDGAGPRGGGAPAPIAALPRQLTAGEQALVAAGNVFGFALLRELTRATPGENIFLSPISASMALGMTMNGANGDTYDEMRTALGFGTTSREEVLRSFRDLIAMLRALDAKVDFRIANSIWYRDSFGASIESAFLNDARTWFDATVSALDFSNPGAPATINNWVRTSTNGKIDQIIDRIPSEMVMFLMNAIYFKGDWRQAFDRSKTAPAPFRTDDGRTISIPLMQRTDTMRGAVLDGRTIVDLGYGGDAFAMTLVLPRAGETADALVASLSPAWWSQATGALRTQEVQLAMPKFTLTWDDTLNASLKAMGMRKAFQPRVADFTRLSSTMGRELYISFVRQKSFVDVHEVGTEAAAVTVVGVGVTSLPQRLQARFDRPFVFAIRERLSGTILFMGKLAAPPTS
jgi:serine protease inhibitor